MANTTQIPLRQLIETLLDDQHPLPPKYFYHLSDLASGDLQVIASNWSQIPLWRRQALMEDVEKLSEDDPLLSFEGISRLALADEDPRVRQLAIHSLWDYEQRDLADIYLRLLDEDESVDVRAAAAAALGKFVYLGEIEELPLEMFKQIEDRLLAKMRSDDSTRVRQCSLEALGFSGRDEVHPLIESAYYSGNDDWLLSALVAMGRSANERWNGMVEQMLSHDRGEIRLEAARAAGELEVRHSLEQLIELLDDPDIEVRMAAIWSLSQIGGEGVRGALEKLYEDAEDEQELDHLEAALDNLDFTEEMGLFSMMELPDVDEDELYEDVDFLEDDEGFPD
jgi:hypothetical protein